MGLAKQDSIRKPADAVLFFFLSRNQAAVSETSDATRWWPAFHIVPRNLDLIAILTVEKHIAIRPYKGVFNGCRWT